MCCIDCANGASAAVARQLFPRLGAKCTFIGVEPDGKNINAGVGSTHLDNLEKAVIEGGFDCGIAFDGDADRCLACDEKGQEIDGDKVIALLAMNMKEKGCLDGNTAVVTVMSNLGFIKYMESQGIHTEKTAVGDRYVLASSDSLSMRPIYCTLASVEAVPWGQLLVTRFISSALTGPV